MKYIARMWFHTLTRTGKALRRAADFLDPPGIGGAFSKNSWYNEHCR